MKEKYTKPELNILVDVPGIESPVDQMDGQNEISPFAIIIPGVSAGADGDVDL